MGIIEYMAQDIEGRITGQLRNRFDDPDLELDEDIKTLIRKSLRKQQRAVQAEIKAQEQFEENCLPGLIEALNDC